MSWSAADGSVPSVGGVDGRGAFFGVESIRGRFDELELVSVMLGLSGVLGGSSSVIVTSFMGVGRGVVASTRLMISLTEVAGPSVVAGAGAVSEVPSCIGDGFGCVCPSVQPGRW